MSVKQSFFTFIACIVIATPVFTQQAVMPDPQLRSADASAIPAPEPQPGRVSGTATDVNDDVIPGANVTLDGLGFEEKRTAVANPTEALPSTISSRESPITSQ